jgi:pilus assembly protein CpaF
VVERMLARAGRRLDRAQPFVDARLPEGSRLHVVIPPITDQWAVNVRKFVGLRASSLDELVALGSCSRDAARFLEAAVRAGLSIVVAGAVGAGKTTLLNCLASAIPSKQRVITCEEVFELRIARPDVVSMQCRQPNLEGEGAVTLRDLVRESLRMRPDRIVVGEVRGAESLVMLLGLNSGAAGMTSVHANSAREALRKLTTLPLLAGENLDRRFVASTVAACVDLVVFCRRSEQGRAITEILAVAPQVGDGDELTTGTVFTGAGSSLRWTGELPSGLERFTERGIDLMAVLR